MIQPKENRIVYILGAGFSAPLGLPVMGNFISRSKDIYFQNKVRYKSFQGVYDTIAQLSVIKNTFHADLYNIEEILSLLEMEAFMKGGNLDRKFVDFLADVIETLQPRIEKIDGRMHSANWHDFIFSKNPLWRPYLEMMASMLGLVMSKATRDENQLIWNKVPTGDKYAIVTLNYDTVIESSFAHVVDSYPLAEPQKLSKGDYDATWTSMQVAKLHGCVVQKNIIPPTWRKGSKEVVDAWKLAYQLVRDANQIRIIGYSLPLSDSYIRYLLKAAVQSSPDLKRIDVLLHDPDSSVEERYRKFVDFNNFRFANAKLEALFAQMSQGLHKYYERGIPDKMPFNTLESAHESVFHGK